MNNNTAPYYPIGIQSFEKIRSMNALYVDKTALIFNLTHRCTNVFLSRPRRFGKSLLTSTLQCYFEGRKELFTGLAMEQLETEWTQYPVFHFDLSVAKGKPVDGIIHTIAMQLATYERRFGITNTSGSLGDRLTLLIEVAYEQTGRQVVILIDEYDAPILDVLHKGEEEVTPIRSVLREFYAPLKMCDKNIRFLFITGISMFSQLSIFSEMNNLEIISEVKDYAAICGITEQELRDNFQYGIREFSEELECSQEDVLSLLKDKYDGYHFSKKLVDIYNPYSLLNAFKNLELKNYWFASGTPKFLIEMLRKYRAEHKFSLEMLESKKLVSSGTFESPLEQYTGAEPLLYQAGYLTLKDYDPSSDQYVLGIPNSEVRTGLLKNLLPLYSDMGTNETENAVDNASARLREGNYDRALQLLQSLLSSIPFMQGDKDILQDAEKTEAYYHRIFYFFFRMLHNRVNAEYRCAKGAADVVISTPKFVYIFEIKIDSTAETALKQIQEKGYDKPFLADEREIVTVGINFSTEQRTLSDWVRG